MEREWKNLELWDKLNKALVLLEKLLILLILEKHSETFWNSSRNYSEKQKLKLAKLQHWRPNARCNWCLKFTKVLVHISFFYLKDWFTIASNVTVTNQSLSSCCPVRIPLKQKYSELSKKNILNFLKNGGYICYWTALLLPSIVATELLCSYQQRKLLNQYSLLPYCCYCKWQGGSKLTACAYRCYRTEQEQS
jgi:hypothetical protein